MWETICDISLSDRVRAV